jgi:hypothetical protein
MFSKKKGKKRRTKNSTDRDNVRARGFNATLLARSQFASRRP